jgi:AraC-like DNA-binding protein
VYSNLQETHPELYELLQETEYLRENPSPFSGLMLRGNLYKIFAYILKDCTAQSENSHRSKKMMSVLHVETALEHIRSNYAQPISVEEVAALCGYSKSNFCKVFKQITGQTFHAVLNDHRLRVACTLLLETQLSVEQIALQVGFSDAKGFCRGFKTVKGVSPGEFRRQQSIR